MFTIQQVVERMEILSQNGNVCRSRVDYAIEEDGEEPLLFFRTEVGKLVEIPVDDYPHVHTINVDAIECHYYFHFVEGELIFFHEEERPEATFHATPPEDDYDEVIEIDAD